MVIKQIFISVCILISSAPLVAMQPQQPAPAANIVTLVSAEGDQFQVPLDAAQEAGTLASMLAFGTSAESAERKFLLNNISSPVMKEIAALMQAVHNNLNLKRNKKAFQDALAPYLKSTLLLDPAFLRAIDFLDFAIIKDLIAYKLAQRIIATQTNVLRIFAHYMTYQKAFAPEITFGQVKQIIEKALGSQEAAARLLDNIARFCFLLIGKQNPAIPEPINGFSIQDYLDYNPSRIEKCWRSHYPAIHHPAVDQSRTYLDLSNLHLASLEGLDHIPNIASATALDLDSNQLQQIQPQIFVGLQNLQKLYLSINQLQQLHPQAFVGLQNLQVLYLGFNYLQQIPPNSFVGLQNLKELSLSTNQLQQIQPNTFAGLQNLQKLYLSHNQLQQIRPQAFAGLQNLRTLHLDYNKLQQIQANAFNGLQNLRALSLNNNQLQQIQPNTFARLQNLQLLYLSNNPLTPENKTAIRAALPEQVEIKFFGNFIFQ